MCDEMMHEKVFLAKPILVHLPLPHQASLAWCHESKMDLTSILGVEGVVEENLASSVMGTVEPTSKNVMVDILRCFLQSDDVPPACNLLLEGIFFSASGPWIPAVDTQPLLHKRTIGDTFVEAVSLRRIIMSPF